jgi:hypothetical protein
MAAQSGVQEGEARLREYFPARYFEGLDLNPPRPRAWKYYGDDITERMEPPVDHKLEDAKSPSFAVERDDDPLNQAPEPKLIGVTIGGTAKQVGYSGTHGGGFYGRNSEHYALKISDISGRIHVNDGVDNDPKAGADTSVSQNLRRILNILGDVQTVPQLGDKIIDMRPPGGYRHVNDMLRCVNYDEKQFERFRDYVTVNAWVDKNVANPVPLSAPYAQEDITGGVKHYRGAQDLVYRAGSEVRGIDAKGQRIGGPLGQPMHLVTYPMSTGDPKAQAITIHGLDTLNPQWIEIVSRAPVNINAASKPVLVSLLTGIRGFFVGYRRRNNPNWTGELYLSFKGQNPLRPAGLGVQDAGDEYGVLMDTVEIVNEKQTTDDRKISAWVLAEEIIACRERRNSPFYNYSDRKAWFAGPFRDWHQFNGFIDNLARPRDDDDPLLGPGPAVLRDNRPVHWDYDPNTGDLTGGGALVGLPFARAQQEHACKAIADALKANFNPNLHLNETNPDENLFLRVDKTDLFINSTEFCFMPTGYFEVESLGRVVRSNDPNVTDVTLSANNILVSQAKVKAIYKIYDQMRETTQKHFYAGTLSPGGSSFPTSNGKSLEVGPEPDNGVFPGNLGQTGDPDNEWGGYIALPTVGGPRGFNKPKNTQLTTKGLGNVKELNSAMHVHFNLDFDANGHDLDQTEIGSGNAGIDDEIANYADWVGNTAGGRQWNVGGPYHPAMSTPTVPIRIARSFRMTKAASGTVVAPGLNFYPPSDLRIDGGYVERHAAPCYMMQKGGSSFWQWATKAEGVVSFWWKPSYRPDLTGKVRSQFDLSRYHASCGQSVHVWPFAMWFYPVNYKPSISEEQPPLYSHNNMGKFNPVSVVFGSKTWHNTSRSHEFGHLSGTLNHDGHFGEACKDEFRHPNILRGHRWIHTALNWNLIGGTTSYGNSAVYLNGKTSIFPTWTIDNWRSYAYTPVTSHTSGWSSMPEFPMHDGGSKNQIRFGGPSEIGSSPKNGATWGYRGNFTGDHTIDEIYVWATAAPDPQTIWVRGRYASPDGQYGEGRFDSQDLDFDQTLAERKLATPSSAMPPGGGPGGSVAAPPVQPKRIRILGLSWTWYGEALRPRELQQMQIPQDRRSEKLLAQWDSMFASGLVEPKVRLSIVDGSTVHGPYTNEYFSSILTTNNNIPFIQDPKTVKYRVEFQTGARFGEVLLATPVLDDVTIFFDDNQSHLLSYVFDNRSF